MLYTSYLFLRILSNSRSVPETKNHPASTFTLNPAKTAAFPHFPQLGAPSTKTRQTEFEVARMFYLCEVATIFGRAREISFICLACRSSWEAIIWNHS